MRHWTVRVELYGPGESYLSQADMKALTYELGHLRPRFEGWPSHTRAELHVVAREEQDAVDYAQQRVAFALRVAGCEDWQGKVLDVEENPGGGEPA